jgi:hypothetical protein
VIFCPEKEVSKVRQKFGYMDLEEIPKTDKKLSLLSSSWTGVSWKNKMLLILTLDVWFWFTRVMRKNFQ